MPQYASLSTQHPVNSTTLKNRLPEHKPADKNLYPDNFSQLPVPANRTVNGVNNVLENEAEAAANKIMRMAEPNLIRRKCAHCREEERIDRKPLTSFIQKKSTENNTVVSDTISFQIQSTKGGGSTMPAATKSFMENRFGADFSSVLVHNNTAAANLSSQLNAQAFTVGNNIYFGAGKYQPESSAGKHLLAHELTHTLQQGSTAATIQKQGAPGENLVCKPPDTNVFQDAQPTAAPVCKAGETTLNGEVVKPTESNTAPIAQPANAPAKTNFQRATDCNFEAPALPTVPTPLPFKPNPAATLPANETAPDLSALHSDKDWWDDKDAEAFGKLLAACYASRTATGSKPVNEAAKLDFLKNDFNEVVQGWFGRTIFGGWFGLAGKLQGMLQKNHRDIMNIQTQANNKKPKDARLTAEEVNQKVEKQMQQKRYDLVESVRLQVAVGTWGWEVERREKLDFDTIGTTNKAPGATLTEVLTDAEMDTIIHNLLITKKNALSGTQIADVLTAAQKTKDGNAKKTKARNKRPYRRRKKESYYCRRVSAYKNKRVDRRFKNCSG